MRLPTTTVAFVLVLLLVAAATSASAQCAWVLWEQITPPRSMGQPWSPLGASSDTESCQSALRSRITRSVSQYPGSQDLGDAVIMRTAGGEYFTVYRCLPDTVDPRGPKGK